ncbi:hypothetical protein Y032_0016g3089 [Ancylostoma ceylanicum]|uniref:Hexosyltransferase n=1 Tax=Ancylostoma ceylanicum TaxID=53326 RepID=A0A016V8L7_9BILA|nr:hypothetical protein Y032_0016g3089 [Ancylostoma ceylanicum]
MTLLGERNKRSSSIPTYRRNQRFSVHRTRRATIRHCVVNAHPRYWQFKRVILAVASVTFLGITAVSLKRKNLVNDPDVEAANARARLMFGNVSFLDSRLQLRSFTIVPNPGKCDNVKFAVIIHIKVDDESGRNRWRATYGNLPLMQQVMGLLKLNFQKISILFSPFFFQKKLKFQLRKLNEVS